MQYVVLRSDLWKSLDWPLGSIVAQACHAATAALWLNRGDSHSQAYCADSNLDHMHKVLPDPCMKRRMDALAHCIRVCKMPQSLITCESLHSAHRSL